MEGTTLPTGMLASAGGDLVTIVLGLEMDAGTEYVSRNIDGWHSTPPKMTVLTGIKMGKAQGKSLAPTGSSGQMIQLNAAGDNAPQLVDGQGHSSAIVALPSWSGNVRLPVLIFVLANFPETKVAASQKNKTGPRFMGPVYLENRFLLM